VIAISEQIHFRARFRIPKLPVGASYQ
jgi:hypothetical protein